MILIYLRCFCELGADIEVLEQFFIAIHHV
jgi:hypothetical protein